jgi:hypothetical protein
MKQKITAAATPAEWDARALYAKSVLYVQQMTSNDSDSWEYALWSSLTLELLARSALANVSPALLAETDGKNWSSLHHALGFEPKDKKFLPRSIPISDVFRRLNSIFPEFTSEIENFGIRHIAQRNSELHSGVPAFQGVNGSTWQPDFFKICKVLLDFLGKDLSEFFGADEATAAEKLIEAAEDMNAKSVLSDVDAHRRVWQVKSEDEKGTLRDQASVWATKEAGHRVVCPSCGSQALIFGDPVSAAQSKLIDGDIVETQEYLPGRFQCIACNLKISGLSRLSVVGCGDRYKKTQRYDAAEYYSSRDDLEGYDEDNNEW